MTQGQGSGIGDQGSGISQIPQISLVVAMAKNRVIGANNGIPWNVPGEQRLFKEITMGHHIVMGRKTYESIGRLLPGRTTVIVTRQPEYAVPGAIIAHSLHDAINAAARDAEIFVIGGAELFREAMPIADRIYLSVIDLEPAGDTFMPEIDAAQWREMSSEQYPGFRYVVLARCRDQGSGIGDQGSVQ
jgi:dihydrofolate reductase